jgi:hypothetical protein
VKSLVSIGNGARKVETYAPQSAENWMEDYGSGTLQQGVSVVKIDPAFAETASETPNYHVFLTPNGDSKGLYVINKTLGSFEVRESGGGTSSLVFDYKIVAKRRGYEKQRLVDVTERFNAEQTRSLAGRAAIMPPPMNFQSRPRPARAFHPPLTNGPEPNGGGAAPIRNSPQVRDAQPRVGRVIGTEEPVAHP